MCLLLPTGEQIIWFNPYSEWHRGIDHRTHNTKHFTGTLLLRIKDTPSSEKTYQSKCENFTANDYFANKKRKFQCIIKGKFKNDLPINQIRTGQLFDRASGTLPARWIVTSAIKFISILAPRKFDLFLILIIFSS